MATTPIQDTINFQLRADTVVVSDTVKIIVHINALVPSDSTENALRAEIKAALASFLPTQWQINGIERASDDSGFERVQMRATARVNETENYNLEGRAKAVSRQGLQLGDVEVDSTVPAPMLEEAEKALRATILKNAKEEAAALADVTGRNYRVGAVNFQNQGDPAIRKMAMASTTANATPYGSGFAAGGGDDESLANAQKVSLSANVTLMVIVQ
jgi:hypothetical protein